MARHTRKPHHFRASRDVFRDGQYLGQHTWKMAWWNPPERKRRRRARKLALASRRRNRTP